MERIRLSADLEHKNRSGPNISPPSDQAPSRLVRHDPVSESIRLRVGYRCKSRWNAARKATRMVEHRHERPHPADGSKARHHEEGLVAYVSAHIFFGSESQWRGCKGRSRAAAAFHCENDPGHVHPSPEPSQASCSEQNSENDKTHGNLYRRCTANERRNPSNRLWRFSSS